MVTNKSKKKSLLALGTALMPTGITMLVKGNTIEGTILCAMALGAIMLYDQYDDRLKVPDGVDEETFKELASLGADGIKSLKDQYQETDSK